MARSIAGVSPLALAVACTGVFLAYLDVTIVNVALPTIADDLGADVRDTSWVVTAYAIAYTALLVTGGRFADARGARGVFGFGLLAFAVTSALCALAPGLWSLVAMRTAQGAAGAVLVTVSLAALLHGVPVLRRGAVIGAWGAAGAAAAGIGPPLGGLLSEVDWRLIFWINVPLAIGAALATRLVPPVPAEHRAGFDVPGVILVGVLVGSLALAITEGPVQGWTSPVILGLFALAAATAVLLVIVEGRARAPVLDPRVFAQHGFAVTNVAAAAFFFAFLANALLAVLVLQGAWGFSPLEAGLAAMPGPVIATAFAPLAGRLVDRHGPRRIGTIGLAVFGAALLALALLVTPEPAYLTRFLPCAIVVSLGVSLAFPAITQAATSELAPGNLATGTGVLATTRQTGGVIGIAAVVSLLGDFPEGIGPYREAYVLLAAGAFLGAVIMLALRRAEGP